MRAIVATSLALTALTYAISFEGGDSSTANTMSTQTRFVNDPPGTQRSDYISQQQDELTPSQGTINPQSINDGADRGQTGDSMYTGADSSLDNLTADQSSVPDQLYRTDDTEIYDKGSSQIGHDSGPGIAGDRERDPAFNDINSRFDNLNINQGQYGTDQLSSNEGQQFDRGFTQPSTDSESKGDEPGYRDADSNLGGLDTDQGQYAADQLPSNEGRRFGPGSAQQDLGFGLAGDNKPDSAYEDPGSNLGSINANQDQYATAPRSDGEGQQTTDPGRSDTPSGTTDDNAGEQVQPQQTSTLGKIQHGITSTVQGAVDAVKSHLPGTDHSHDAGHQQTTDRGLKDTAQLQDDNAGDNSKER